MQMAIDVRRLHRRPRPTSCARRWAPSARPSGWSGCAAGSTTAWPSARHHRRGGRPDLREAGGLRQLRLPREPLGELRLPRVYSSWLKLHHPAAFCAALLNAQPMGFYSPQSLVADARRHGVAVRGPDVNASLAHATLENAGTRGAARPRQCPPHRRRVGRADRRRAKSQRTVHLSAGPHPADSAERSADRGAGHRRSVGLLRDHPPRRRCGRRARRPRNGRTGCREWGRHRISRRCRA